MAATNETPLKLLLIDDDEGILEVLERYFSLDERIRAVHVAENGDEALETFVRDGPFDVVVCDQRLPDLTGVEILTKVRQKEPNTIRILMTGYQDREAAVAAINKAKIHRYVQKPVELSTLSHIIFGLIEEREMRRVDNADLQSAREMAKAIQDFRRKRSSET